MLHGTFFRRRLASSGKVLDESLKRFTAKKQLKERFDLPPVIIESLENRIFLTTVSWNSDSNGDWAIGENWSSGQVPAQNDDVIIDRPGVNVTITISSGTNSVKSITSAEELKISGGSLTVAANSQISGALSLVAASLVVNGVGATLNASGVTTVDRGTLLANQGGILDLSNFKDFTQNQGNNAFQADGAGSKINLSALTTIVGDPNIAPTPLSISATNGGFIDLSGVTQIPSSVRVSFISNGANSTINIDNLATIIGHSVYGSLLEVRNNGVIQSSKLDTAQNMVIAKGTGTINTAQIDHADFSAFSVNSGGVLDLTGLTSYKQPAINQNWQADGAGSRINLSSLTAISGDPGSGQASLNIRANSGSSIHLDSLVQIPNFARIMFLANSSNSTISLTNLTNFIGHATYGSTMEVRNQGIIQSPKLDTAQFVGLIHGLGTMDTVQIKHADFSSFLANSGGILDLSGLTSYKQPLVAQTFEADDPGSKVVLSSLTSISGDPNGNQGPLNIKVTLGGVLDLSQLTQIPASLRVSLVPEGTGSIIKLNALSKFQGHATYGSSLDVRSGGKVEWGPGPYTSTIITDIGTVLTHAMITPLSYSVVVGAPGSRSMITTNSDLTFTSFPIMYYNSLSINKLTIGNAASLILTLNGNNVIRVKGLNLASQSAIDIGNNDMIIDATVATRTEVFATLINLIASGRDTGGWNGFGIISFAAAASIDRTTGVAISLNDNGQGNRLYNQFDGQSLADTNSILIKYSWNGDADLNGKIDANDYFNIDRGFLSSFSPNPSYEGYANGDFDYNHTIDADDFILIDSAFIKKNTTLSTHGVAAVTASKTPARKARQGYHRRR
jgi:hypothetical protein